MVLLAAGTGGGAGSGEGVLQVAGPASRGCGAWFDRLTMFGGDGGHRTLAGWRVRCPEYPLGQWHTVRVLESGTVILECKDGKYEPLGEEDVMTLQ